MDEKPSTREPQYNILFDVVKKHGVSELGLMVNQSWNQDPKRTLFTLARYKFVARMLSGSGSVLEVGCADAFGTRLVQRYFDNVFIFSMNDETIHTGFYPMAHYLLALCCGVKKK